MNHETFNQLPESEQRELITEALTDLALSYFREEFQSWEQRGAEGFMHEVCDQVNDQLEALEEMEDPGVMDHGMHEKGAA